MKGKPLLDPWLPNKNLDSMNFGILEFRDHRFQTFRLFVFAILYGLQVSDVLHEALVCPVAHDHRLFPAPLINNELDVSRSCHATFQSRLQTEDYSPQTPSLLSAVSCLPFTLRSLEKFLPASVNLRLEVFDYVFVARPEQVTELRFLL